MAEFKLTLKVKMPDPTEFERLGRWFGTLSAQKKDQFQREWDALQNAGAEIADTGFSYGIVHCWISDDLRQHCRRFGFEFRQG